MILDMDTLEIERLAKAIRKTFAGQPHKVKYWLALLDMYGPTAVGGEVPGGINLEKRGLDVCTVSDDNGINASDSKAGE
jgi:hypothetical protein